MKYLIVIHKDPDSDYGVIVPDLPGCFSAGSTMDEAMDMAKNAIAEHIEALLIDDEDIPSPSLAEVHHQNPDYEGGTFAFILTTHTHQPR